MDKFVMVHGAWLGAWCWDKVAGILHDHGYKTLAIDLPGHGSNYAPIGDQDIHTYSDCIAEYLRKEEEPVILVAHSMGGMSVSEAAAKVPEKVKKIVYLTAFLPQDGESNNYYGTEIRGIQEMNWPAMGKDPKSGVVLSEDGRSMRLAPELAIPLLYNDCPKEVGVALCNLHDSESLTAPYTAACLNKAFASIPKYYIKCAQDVILPADIQEKMMAATPVEKVYTIDSGHCPYISKPGDVADILMDIEKI